MSSLFALASAALYGAADFMGGLASRSASTFSVVLLSQSAGLALLILTLPALPAASPTRADLVWGGVAGVAGSVGVGLLYRALAIGTMAVVAPTTAVCAVLIPVAVALVLGERPTPQTLAGIAMALVAITFVSHQPAPASHISAPSRGLPRGLGLALLSGVAIGLFYLALARTAPSAGLWPLVVARAASSVLFGAVVFAGPPRVQMPRRVLMVVVGAGGLDMLANVLYLLASRTGPLSTVVTLASLYPASTVLLARLVLGERLNAHQTAGLVCALVAVMLIVGRGA
jgi:drug/metabolite transporter (DMT)-like permease